MHVALFSMILFIRCYWFGNKEPHFICQCMYRCVVTISVSGDGGARCRVWHLMDLSVGILPVNIHQPCINTSPPDPDQHKLSNNRENQWRRGGVWPEWRCLYLSVYCLLEARVWTRSRGLHREMAGLRPLRGWPASWVPSGLWPLP